MKRRALCFNEMMIRLGLEAIKHPALPISCFDREEFHYSREGRLIVEKYIVR
jgi:hypothetical protein